MHSRNVIEMILMTKSSKYGKYCIAGFECGTGRWVRLVSDDEQTHGAVSDEMLYDACARRCADVLDRVRVEIRERCPGRVQTENVLVDGAGKIRILKRMSLSDAANIHPFENQEKLFLSHHHIVQVDAETLGHSLEFVRAENVRIYTQIGSGSKPKYKVDFECGGRIYSQLSMTDPIYYDRREHHIPQAAMVLSISDDEWSRANGHYIYAAKIFDIEKENASVGRKLRRSILAAALIAAGIAAWIAAASAAMVWVLPYSGAPYHADERCSQIRNPAAAYRLPEPIAAIFCAPCAECTAADEN